MCAKYSPLQVRETSSIAQRMIASGSAVPDHVTLVDEFSDAAVTGGYLEGSSDLAEHFARVRPIENLWRHLHAHSPVPRTLAGERVRLPARAAPPLARSHAASGGL
jgi:hypothetical protein